MGLFDLFKRETVETVTTEQTTTVEPMVDDVLLKALLDGETITREKAMTLPAVSGAVDFISNAVACMPVRLFKHKDGKVEEVEKDPRVRMLNGDTGDTLDAFQMKKAMVADYLLGKGGYCYIRKNRNDVTGLFYVEDIYVSIMRVPEPIYKDYQILIMGNSYRPYDFIKLLRNTKDGASGVGLTVEISKELETAYQTMLYQLGMVRSGGNKKGFLKSQRKLGQEEINVLKQAWKNLYQNNSENVVVLNNGLEFQEASNSSVEMQLNESKRTLQDEINNLFHISNDFDLTFKLAIYPIVKAFETALNRDLLLEREKGSMYFEFDVKEIIKASLKERYDAYKLAKETGFMTLNEIRRAENMNWVEGLDVVNVGLGAVLYDINEHVYYTPNTDTVGDLSDGGQNEQDTDKMLEAHEEEQAYDQSGNSAERALRFNPNHGSDGRFSTGSGSGSTFQEHMGSENAKIDQIMGKKIGKVQSITMANGQVVERLSMDEMKFQLKEVKDHGEMWEDYSAEILYKDGSYAFWLEGDDTSSMKLSNIQGAIFNNPSSLQFAGKGVVLKNWNEPAEDSDWPEYDDWRLSFDDDQNKRFNPNHDNKGRFSSGGSGGILSGDALKQAQLELIQKHNPKDPNLNRNATWVESIKDIKTWQEAMHDDEYGEGDVTPDFKWQDALNAEKKGVITVYSSKPIKEGSFITPSKMLAQSYGNKNPYSMTVNLDDVAWIDMSEGQYAKINRDMQEVRFNPNHDAKTGRFTVGTGSGSGVGASSDGHASYKKADSSTQAYHMKAIEDLQDDKYGWNNTYDLDTLQTVSYPNGYQVTFFQIGDSYTPEEYADKVNEFLRASSDGKASAGKFKGSKEVSFHVKDRDVAVALAKKYNQESVFDWENGWTIDTGGTGRRK